MSSSSDGAKSDVRVLKFDTDEQPDLAELFQIGGLPTLLFLVPGSDGQPKVRVECVLTARLRAHLWFYLSFLSYLRAFLCALFLYVTLVARNPVWFYSYHCYCYRWCTDSRGQHRPNTCSSWWTTTFMAVQSPGMFKA